jgi:hypothetical protein
MRVQRKEEKPMNKYVLMQKSGQIFIENPARLPTICSSYEVGTLESKLNPWELRAGIADRYIKELKVKERMLNKIYDFVCETYDTSGEEYDDCPIGRAAEFVTKICNMTDEEFLERYGVEDE